jgi:hypothetical protein
LFELDAEMTSQPHDIPNRKRKELHSPNDPKDEQPSKKQNVGNDKATG